MDSEKDLNNSKLPIFYSKNYDISFGGLEKMHAFDASKWKRIIDFLIKKSDGLITKDRIYEPTEATEEELKLGHSNNYLSSLKWSVTVAKIVEVALIAAIPNFLVNRRVLSKFRYQVKGTMMAAEMALNRKWAINIGGGFHHASYESGGGFCVYADISIAIKALQKKNPDLKFLIVDLDAHQGNGHERDFPQGRNVIIMDMYNQGIYPKDEAAKGNIFQNVPLTSWTNDTEYMEKLKEGLGQCLQFHSPNLIVYNAGTDCLEGDPLGRLDITPEGIKQRDKIVFQMAKDKDVPIVMVTSGGYQYSNAEIIADSIYNLFKEKIIE